MPLSNPIFPDFKPLELADLEILRTALSAYRPQTSELTFSNLFIWRKHYDFRWCVHQDWVFIVTGGANAFALQPIGPEPRADATMRLLDWLRDQPGTTGAIERADTRLAEQLRDRPEFDIESVRDHFDYVYRAQDLVQLAGRKYHSKRNHINKFKRTHPFRYEPLAGSHIDSCMALAESWCKWRRCDEDLSLLGEWDAVREALENFGTLGIEGGAVFVEDRLEAFAIGEWLNRDTVVIHVEKANAEIPGLYPLVNQQFCEHAWAKAAFVNREQDLGEPGLRKAKESYYPDHLVEKYRIRRQR